MSPRRGGRGDYSPRKEDRRERDYDRRGGRDRERDRSRSPDVRDREMKDREREDDQDREREPEAPANGDDHKGMYIRSIRARSELTFHTEAPEDVPPPQHDDLDTAE